MDFSHYNLKQHRNNSCGRHLLSSRKMPCLHWEWCLVLNISLLTSRLFFWTRFCLVIFPYCLHIQESTAGHTVSISITAVLVQIQILSCSKLWIFIQINIIWANIKSLQWGPAHIVWKLRKDSFTFPLSLFNQRSAAKKSALLALRKAVKNHAFCLANDISRVTKKDAC